MAAVTVPAYEAGGQYPLVADRPAAGWGADAGRPGARRHRRSEFQTLAACFALCKITHPHSGHTVSEKITDDLVLVRKCKGL